MCCPRAHAGSARVVGALARGGCGPGGCWWRPRSPVRPGRGALAAAGVGRAADGSARVRDSPPFAPFHWRPDLHSSAKPPNSACRAELCMPGMPNTAGPAGFYGFVELDRSRRTSPGQPVCSAGPLGGVEASVGGGLGIWSFGS